AALPSRSATAGAARFSSAASVVGQKAPASEGGRYKNEKGVGKRPSAFGMSGAGVAAAPALEPAEKSTQALQVPSGQAGMAVPQKKTAEVAATGVEAGQGA